MMQGCAGRWRPPGCGAPANSVNFRTPPGPPTKALLPVDPPRKICGAVLRTRCSARWPRGWQRRRQRRKVAAEEAAQLAGIDSPTRD